MGRNMNLPVKELDKKISKSEFMRYSIDKTIPEVQLDREDRFEIEVLRIQDAVNNFSGDKKVVLDHIVTQLKKQPNPINTRLTEYINENK
jgi:hypothetical protein